MSEQKKSYKTQSHSQDVGDAFNCSFDSSPFHFTMDKLFKYRHQTAEYGTGQKELIPWDWEGDQLLYYTSGIALAKRHRLIGISTYAVHVQRPFDRGRQAPCLCTTYPTFTSTQWHSQKSVTGAVTVLIRFAAAVAIWRAVLTNLTAAEWRTHTLLKRRTATSWCLTDRLDKPLAFWLTRKPSQTTCMTAHTSSKNNGICKGGVTLIGQA